MEIKYVHNYNATGLESFIVNIKMLAQATAFPSIFEKSS